MRTPAPAWAALSLATPFMVQLGMVLLCSWLNTPRREKRIWSEDWDRHKLTNQLQKIPLQPLVLIRQSFRPSLLEMTFTPFGLSLTFNLSNSPGILTPTRDERASPSQSPLQKTLGDVTLFLGSVGVISHSTTADASIGLMQHANTAVLTSFPLRMLHVPTCKLLCFVLSRGVTMPYSRTRWLCPTLCSTDDSKKGK